MLTVAFRVCHNMSKYCEMDYGPHAGTLIAPDNNLSVVP